MDEQNVKELCRELKHEYKQKYNSVFNIGDVGKNFYVILSGAVYVLLLK